MNIFEYMIEYPVQTFIAILVLGVLFTVLLVIAVKVLGLTAIDKLGLKFKKEIETKTDRFYFLQSIVDKRRTRQLYLRHKGTVLEQMNFAELNIAEIEKRLNRVFSDYLKAKKLPPDQEMMANRYFEWMKEMAEVNCKDELRRSFWENHFSEKEGDTWRVYKEKQYEKIRDIFFIYISHMERLDVYLEYGKMIEAFAEHKIFFKSIVDVMYDGARDIALKHRQEIECLEDMNKETYRQYLHNEDLTTQSDVEFCMD